jgi:hypothetical protein
MSAFLVERDAAAYRATRPPIDSLQAYRNAIQTSQ